MKSHQGIRPGGFSDMRVRYPAILLCDPVFEKTEI